MGKAIPDRWLKYQPIGQRVPSTRFIAFKVPLSRRINNTVDEELRLAPCTLLESVPNLGLVVDLTNTNRYYSPQDFTNQNVKHQKLMIPGHQTPTKELAQTFCDYVTKFLNENADNDKLIGVHCTHGVNRTGYLICYFMITRMDMSAKLAIQTFADARGHRIERENYTSSLMNLNQELDSNLIEERIDSARSQPEGKTPKNCDNTQWPRQYPMKYKKERNEERSSVWRQDQSSWQRQQQELQQHQQRQQERYQQRQRQYMPHQSRYQQQDMPYQSRYQQQDMPHQSRYQQLHQQQHRYNSYSQDRSQSREERWSQQRPQRSWRVNETERSEYNHNSFNDQKDQEKWKAWQPQYRRHNQNNNYRNKRRDSNYHGDDYNLRRQ